MAYGLENLAFRVDFPSYKHMENHIKTYGKPFIGDFSSLAVNGVSHNDHLGSVTRILRKKADIDDIEIYWYIYIDDIYIFIYWWYWYIDDIGIYLHFLMICTKKKSNSRYIWKIKKKRTNRYFKTFKTLLNMLYLCIPCESLSSHTHWASPDEDSPIHGLKFGERCQVPLGVTGTLWTLRKVQLMRSGLAL